MPLCSAMHGFKIYTLGQNLIKMLANIFITILCKTLQRHKTLRDTPLL